MSVTELEDQSGVDFAPELPKVLEFPPALTRLADAWGAGKPGTRKSPGNPVSPYPMLISATSKEGTAGEPGTELVFKLAGDGMLAEFNTIMTACGGTGLRHDSDPGDATIAHVDLVCTPSQAAHALGGTPPTAEYIVENELVYVTYTSKLNGVLYTDPRTVCAPTLTAVARILEHLKDSNQQVSDIVAEYRKIVFDPYPAMAEAVGPHANVPAVLHRMSEMTIKDFLKEDVLDCLSKDRKRFSIYPKDASKPPRYVPVLETPTGRRHRMEWRNSDAYTNILVSSGCSGPPGFFPTISRHGPEPTYYSSVDGLPSKCRNFFGEHVNVMVLDVSFRHDNASTAKRNGTREGGSLSASGEYVPVSVLSAQRKKWLDRNKAESVVLADCEASLMGLVSQTVLDRMRNPATSLPAPAPEGKFTPQEHAAWKSARNKFEPYVLEGGEFLLLTQVLAADDPESENRAWGTFCEEAVKAFYPAMASMRANGRFTGHPNMWSYLGEFNEDYGPEDYRSHLFHKVRAMMSSRAGRSFTDSEVVFLADRVRNFATSRKAGSSARPQPGKMFTMGFDRGLAMHRNPAIPAPW